MNPASGDLKLWLVIAASLVLTFAVFAVLESWRGQSRVSKVLSLLFFAYAIYFLAENRGSWLPPGSRRTFEVMACIGVLPAIFIAGWFVLIRVRKSTRWQPRGENSAE